MGPFRLVRLTPHVASTRPSNHLLARPHPRFVFVYGLLVYNLLGTRAETDFIQSWLVALGVDNASQWREVLQDALKAGALLFLADRLWLLSNSRWMEDHVDYLSVQATMLTGATLTRWQRIKAHLNFYAYVQDD